MDIAQIAAEIIQAINSNLSSQWNSDGWDYVNGNVVIYVESDTLGNESDVAVTYNNIADTATLSTGEISLVGVLNNVTVGSLTSANFDLTAG
jgi:hypothetical protein